MTLKKIIPLKLLLERITIVNKTIATILIQAWSENWKKKPQNVDQYNHFRGTIDSKHYCLLFSFPLSMNALAFYQHADHIFKLCGSPHWQITSRFSNILKHSVINTYISLNKSALFVKKLYYRYMIFECKVASRPWLPIVIGVFCPRQGLSCC